MTETGAVTDRHSSTDYDCETDCNYTGTDNDLLHTVTMTVSDSASSCIHIHT